jgi:hypothetical protein
LGESWAVKIDFVEKSYIHFVELRGVDVGHEFLQIFGNAFESKFVESREDRAFWGRQTWNFPVRARLRGLESKGKGFETGQSAEESGHRSG